MRTVLFLGADAAYLYAFRGPLMTLFRERGYRVVAVATERKEMDGAEFAPLGVEFIPWPLRKAGLDPLSDLAPIWRLWRILRRQRPDILFAHTIKPVIYGLLLGWLMGIKRRTVMIPGLGYAFTEVADLRRRLVGAAARAGYRLALSKAHMIILQNHDDLETLKRQRVVRCNAKVGIVNGSGVDMRVFEPAPWPEGPPTFLMLSRLLKDKGVYEFAEAARIVRRALPDARFIMAGGTDVNPAAVPRAQVEAWVVEGLIEAPGHVSDPRQLFASSHVFVLPSYREGCPRVNLEAMAMARPVITTDVPGCRETVIHGETGLLVPVADAAGLAEAMISLGGNPERAKRLGVRGRELCRTRYELSKVVRHTGDLIEGEVHQ